MIYWRERIARTARQQKRPKNSNTSRKWCRLWPTIALLWWQRTGPLSADPRPIRSNWCRQHTERGHASESFQSVRRTYRELLWFDILLTEKTAAKAIKPSPMAATVACQENTLTLVPGYVFCTVFIQFSLFFAPIFEAFMLLSQSRQGA
jgi:hypothetical protein